MLGRMKTARGLLRRFAGASAILAIIVLTPVAQADETDDLAKLVQNPVANLISVPVESNFDFGLGPNNDGYSYLLNVQPVIPFKLSDDWLLVTRTIIPFSHVEIPGLSSEAGLGDILQSFFFSPRNPKGGIIWGLGPVLLYPSATNDALGSEKLGIGPTGVVLVQRGSWTVGGLANHVWSVAGDSSRQSLSLSFLQPFIAYSLGDGYSVSAQTKFTYNWKTEASTVVLQAGGSKVFTLAGQAMNLGLQGRFYANRPAGGPDWGVTVSLSFLFPTK